MRKQQCSTSDSNYINFFRLFAPRSTQALDCRKIATTQHSRQPRQAPNSTRAASASVPNAKQAPASQEGKRQFFFA
jgi:hypothetical protein